MGYAMRRMWVVVSCGGGVLVAGLVVFGAFQRKCERELAEITDLRAGLTWFIEQHEGRFPSSRQEFLASPVVEQLAGGTVRISCQTRDACLPFARGYAISDVEQYRVRWGCNLSCLSVDSDGVARGPAGNEVRLIEWGRRVDMRRHYTRHLIDVARQTSNVVGVRDGPRP